MGSKQNLSKPNVNGVPRHCAGTQHGVHLAGSACIFTEQKNAPYESCKNIFLKTLLLFFKNNLEVTFQSRGELRVAKA